MRATGIRVQSADIFCNVCFSGNFLKKPSTLQTPKPVDDGGGAVLVGHPAVRGLPLTGGAELCEMFLIVSLFLGLSHFSELSHFPITATHAPTHELLSKKKQRWANKWFPVGLANVCTI